MAGFGGSVKLTGESEYKKALQNIRAGLREVSSEMKLMGAQFQSSDRNTTALTNKSAELSRKLADQKKAIANLKTSYNEMARQYDNQTKKTAELQKSLDGERSKLEQIKNALGTSSKEYQEQANVVDKLEEELKQSEKAQDGMAKSLQTMRTQLNNAEASIVKTDNTLDKYEKELDEATKDEKEVGNQADKMGKDIKNASTIASSSSKGFTVLKGVLANLASQGVSLVIQGVKDLAKSTLNASVDFNKGMSKVAAISGATGKELDELSKKAKQMGKTTQFTAGQSAEAFQYMAMAGWKAEDMLEGIDGVMNLAAASGEDLATTSDIVTDAITAFGLSAKDSAHFSDVLAVASSNANTNVSMMGETFKYVAPVAGSLDYSVESVAQSIGLMANSGIKASQAGTSLRAIITRLSTDAGASSKSLGALGILTDKLGVQFYNADGTARDFNDVINESREAWKGLSKEEQQNYAKKIAGQNAISGWNALMNASTEDVNNLSVALANADGTAQSMADTMMDNLGGDLTKLSSAFEGLQLSISEGATNPLREMVQTITTEVIPALEGMVNGAEGADAKLGTALSSLVNKALTTLTNALPRILKFGVTFIVELAKGIVSGLPKTITMITKSFSQMVKDLVTGLSELLETANVDEIVSAAVELFMAMQEAFPTIIEKLTPSLVNFVVQIAASLVKNSPLLLASMIKLWLTMPVAMAKAVVETVKQIPSSIKNILGVWDKIKEGFSKIVDTIKSNAEKVVGKGLVNVFKEAWKNIKETFSKVGEFFGDLWDTIKEKFSKLGTSIASAIGSSVKSGINGVITLIQNTINSAIRMINGAIKFINKTPGVNISTIGELHFDRLAKGGIVNRPTFAEIGEDGREAVIPLENNTGWIKQLAAELHNTMATVSTLNSTSTETVRINQYNELVNSFKDAIKQVKIELDDEQLGSFVEKTVVDAIYT